MMAKEEVVQLHEKLNQQFWGAPGIRDMAALEAALARPLATFDGEALYTSELEKIAALTESLVINHPFYEGNMRTAYVLLRLFLLEQGLDLSATEEERHTLMLQLATAQLRHGELVRWLQNHTYQV